MPDLAELERLERFQGVMELADQLSQTLAVSDRGQFERLAALIYVLAQEIEPMGEFERWLDFVTHGAREALAAIRAEQTNQH